MVQRSPHMNEMIREWTKRNSNIVAPPYAVGPLSNEVYDAWIANHPQKPFVISSHIEGDLRKITILCTNCADLHYFETSSEFGTLDGYELKPPCPEKYLTGKPYMVTDGEIKHKHLSRRVKTYETGSTKV